MKRYCWTVINKTTNEKIGYKSNFGPVTEEHVRTSPSVKRWLNGADCDILPEVYVLMD